MNRDVEFEIALSFAGENRTYVDQVANLLRDSGVKVFYDLFEEASPWGKNLLRNGSAAGGLEGDNPEAVHDQV